MGPSAFRVGLGQGGPSSVPGPGGLCVSLSSDIFPREGPFSPRQSFPVTPSASCPLQVLNMNGKVVTVRHQAVTRKKDNRFAVALDSEQNNIHVKDIVKVIDGPHSVSRGIVTIVEPQVEDG